MMIDFIVSGQIPGIHLEVTFLLWQILIVGTLAYAAVRTLRRLKHIPAPMGEDEA